MTKIFFSLFVLMASLVTSQDFRVELSLPKTEFILAEPIMPTGTVTNITGRELTISEGEGGFSSYFIVERLDGKPRKGCLREVGLGGLNSSKKILPGWTESKTHTINCQDEVGRYKIRFRVSSDIDSSMSQTGKQLWTGSIESVPLLFSITEPVGIDREAFEHFMRDPLRPENMGQLLQQYPRSVYSAYAVLQTFDIKGVQPEMVLKQIASGSYFSDSVPDDSGQASGGWRTLSRDEALAWRDKWFNIVQTNHPNIWFGDELRLRKALDNIALKRYDVASADLRLIKKDHKKLGETAERYLILLKERGLIRE
jgi:hypothetical protein